MPAWLAVTGQKASLLFFKKGRKSDLLVLPSATEIILLNSKTPTQNRTLCQLVYLERGKYSHRFFFSATLNIYFETYLTFLLNKSCFNYSDNLSYYGHNADNLSLIFCVCFPYYFFKHRIPCNLPASKLPLFLMAL